MKRLKTNETPKLSKKSKIKIGIFISISVICFLVVIFLLIRYFVQVF